MSARAAHWQGIYEATPSSAVSWYAREPANSVRLIEKFATGASRAVVDAGAGASLLVDRLLADGYTDVTLVDVSEHALTEVAERLGERARSVTFVHDDLMTWTPERQYDVWHDRAVFHFLTEAADRDRYTQLVARAVRTGGVLIVATFAAGGPTRCSGLPVARYPPERLADVFSEYFELVEQELEEHVTPASIVQPFTWVVLRRARRAVDG